MKNPFSTKKIKDNWNKTLSDPYTNVRFQYKVTRYLVYFVMIIIGLTIGGAVISALKGSTWNSKLVSVAMSIIGIYLLWTIYSKTILPQKKILQHYENVPQPISSKHVDVAKEVDDIISHFDNKEKLKK